MTQHDTSTDTDIATKDLVLATDLDGTFLGGSEDERARFYSWIEANRSTVGLIFVTGRDTGFIREIVRAGDVPRPDYVVADVGTTIASVDAKLMFAPIEALEAEISEKWNNANDRVLSALHTMSGLKLQSTLFRHRVSYDMQPGQLDPRAQPAIEELGLDVLISDNKFFDVLPKGVSKGPSLLRLLAHLGVQNDRTLVAGDTLNDLSMLELGLPAVAVGNSEQALIDAVEGLGHVRVAKGHGVAGIAEAIVQDELYKAA